MPERPPSALDPPQGEFRDPPQSQSAPEGVAACDSDPLSAMTPRFNVFFRWFANRFFRHFELAADTVATLRELESRGSVVYVMRYSSRLDYFLFNSLFQRQGLRLSSFANGLRFYYYRPLLTAVRTTLRRPRRRSSEEVRSSERDHLRRAVGAGESLFLFLRTARFRSFLRGSRTRRQDELDLLQEVVRLAWDSQRQVFVVPLAIFWRKGPRAESRFLNLSYGSLTRPSDLAKVSGFLANYRSLSVKTGEAIDIASFIAEHREEGLARVARKVRRSLFIYLYREEKVVEGPTLRPRYRVLREIMQAPRVEAAIRERAKGKRRAGSARAEAEKMFFEIAANMNSTILAVLAAAVGWVFRRMFAGLEVVGLETVAEHAKRHPIVLVPSHRSYFDFLILSWLFYSNFLVPPHIYARDNMTFGPFGFLFRRVGAFFARGSFDDPLYKEVFRAYVAYLVREGFTQEFFIEGGRSRTGKSMAPRMGMLSWDVDAFLQSARRDLFFVPVAITYERLVEEVSMVEELSGGVKTKETMLGLVRARKYLQGRFGTAHLCFGEPISLADELGDLRELFVGPAADQQLEAKRAFVDRLGHRIVERINWAVIANATSVAASVILGFPHRGLRREQLVTHMRDTVSLLQLQGVRMTSALESDSGDFQESISFLLKSDLLKLAADPAGEILYFDESRRRALDLYRNTIVHFLCAPSFMARLLLAGASQKELSEEASFWQDLLYQEYFTPRGEGSLDPTETFVLHFERMGWIGLRSGSDTYWEVTQAGRSFMRCLEAQTRGVLEAYRSLVTVVLHGPGGEMKRKELCKQASEHFSHAQLLGEAERSEATNDTTFGNALDLLVSRGMVLRSELQEADPGRRSREALYRLPEDSEELASLQRRLARALSAG